MRDRLIELLKSPHKAEQLRQTGVDIGKYEDDCVEAMIADFLLANGVIVPPVKIGQTVYVVSRYYGGLWRIHECRVFDLTIYEKHIFMRLVDRDYNFGMEISEIGKTVFLTKEEAEKALAERSGK